MSSSSEIKEQLLFVSNKIDEAIRQYRETKAQEIHVKQQEDLINDNSPNFIGKITSLKTKVESLQKNLEEVYKIDKINQLESDIKKKEKLLEELKGERHILYKAVKEQNKGINEYLSKFDSTKEQKELSDQIKNVKEENHNHKEIYKEMNNRIKTQKSKIDALEKRCLIIKQNIEFQKKKNMKEIKKNSKEEKNDEEEDDFGGNVELMEEAEKNLINEINIEEKNYRAEINAQSDVIKKINTDIKKIEFKIKNLIQEKKMDEIKKKNRTRGRSTTRIQQNHNSTKNNQSRDDKRNLSNYKQKPNPKNINYLKNNKKINDEKRAMLRTPNFNIKNSDKFGKPFEIKKFNDFSNNKKNNIINDDKNYTTTMFNDNKKLKLTSFNDNSENKSINGPKNNKSNKRSIALKEIESLKNEIQNALKNNIVILNDNEEIQNNTNNILKKEKNNELNFLAKQTGEFTNEKNNNEKDEFGNNSQYNFQENNKNNYKKTVLLQSEPRSKDYQLISNDKLSEDSSKRKPFDKFIFK